MTERENQQQVGQGESQQGTGAARRTESAELTDEELEKVAGGVTNQASNTVSVIDTSTYG
jgi:hypothetical protein